MRIRVLMSTGLAGLVLAAAPVWAHHAFQAEFDENKPVTLKGVITSMEWINPHSWIHIEVTNDQGEKEEWMVEGGSPNIMLRRGFTKESLKKGTEVTIQGYQAISGRKRANGGSITFKDGTKLFVGGSNPDDPGNGKK